MVKANDVSQQVLRATIQQAAPSTKFIEV